MMMTTTSYYQPLSVLTVLVWYLLLNIPASFQYLVILQAFLTSLVPILGSCVNFHTSLVLVFSGCLIFGWYEPSVYYLSDSKLSY
jgi:hypothetical protein